MSSSLSLMFLSPKPSIHSALNPPPQFRGPISVYNHNLKPARFATNGNKIKSVPERNQQQWVSVSTELKKSRWETVLETAVSLYPFYVTGGAIAAWYKPSTFSWVVERAPGSYSLAVGFIMFAMGLTLELADLFNLMMQRPLSVN